MVCIPLVPNEAGAQVTRRWLKLTAQLSRQGLKSHRALGASRGSWKPQAGATWQEQIQLRCSGANITPLSDHTVQAAVSKAGKNIWPVFNSVLYSASPLLPFPPSPTYCCCCPHCPQLTGKGGVGSSTATPGLLQLEIVEAEGKKGTRKRGATHPLLLTLSRVKAALEPSPCPQISQKQPQFNRAAGNGRVGEGLLKMVGREQVLEAGCEVLT